MIDGVCLLAQAFQADLSSAPRLKEPFRSGAQACECPIQKPFEVAAQGEAPEGGDLFDDAKDRFRGLSANFAAFTALAGRSSYVMRSSCLQSADSRKSRVT